MRVLFTSLPATGHFNSIMPTALATAAAGHEVAICSANAFADEVQRAGLQHLPGGAESLGALAVGAPPLGDPERPRFMQQQVFAGRAPQRLIPDLSAQIDAWQPDLLVRESSEFAACLLGVLAEPRYRDNAGAFAEEMQALPPIEHAVELLEQLAREGRAIPRA